MAKLNPDTHVLLDGAAKVYLRSNTKRWQAKGRITELRDRNVSEATPERLCHTYMIDIGHRIAK